MEDISDDDIEAFIVRMMEKDPVKFVQYCLVVIGRDIFKSNAASFKFNQEADLEESKRFVINVIGTIKEVKKK